MMWVLLFFLGALAVIYSLSTLVQVIVSVILGLSFLVFMALVVIACAFVYNQDHKDYIQ